MSSPKLQKTAIALYLLLGLGLFPGLGFSIGGRGEASAQSPQIKGLPTLSGETEDRFRMDQLLGLAPTEGFLLRTPATLMRRMLESEEPFSITLLAPEIRGIRNSDLPFSFNDGALWAGRGLNAVVTVGARFSTGPVTLVLAPQWIYQENQPFQFIPYPLDGDPARSLHANAFHPPPESMDYPMRFGEESLSEVGAGQSSLTVAAGPVDFGLSTENAWWGPGIRNGIVLSSHAAGVPRAFLRTAHPIRTRLGDFEGEWILGQLAESDFFDEDPANDDRTLSAIALTFQPAFDTGLTLGMARTVFAPLAEGDSPVGATLDALKSVGRPNRLEAEAEPVPGPDQILSVFGRWVFAPFGFEVYGEWARFEEAASIRDFLEFPQHTQGYTFGLQWVKPHREEGKVRLQAEMTNLEPAGTWRYRRPFSSYASRVVDQGYTHRGQVLGASIGPGASSQWLAGDYLASRWRAGAFAGRVRWDAAAWLSGAVKEWSREDVSAFWGLRGGVELQGWTLAGEVTTGVRINYLFQTFAPEPVSGQAEGVDIENTTVSMTLSKTLWR